MKTRDLRLCRLVFAIGTLLCLILLFRRAAFGTSGADESFYLALPYRILQGDSLFSQEWHLSQSFSILLLLPMRIYLALFSEEGMYMFFRCFFVCVHAAMAAAIYALTEKRDGPAAVFSGWLYLLFVPYGLYQICYNSMGPGLLLLALLLSGRAWETHRALPGILSGLMLALAVLCTPYLLLLYLAGMVWSAVRAIRRRSVREFLPSLWITAGAAAVAAAFLIFVLSRASLSEILANLPGMFSDPTHTTGGQLSRLVDVSIDMVQRFWVSLVGGALLFAAACLRRVFACRGSREKMGKIALPYLLLLAVPLLWTMYVNMKAPGWNIHYILMPAALAAPWLMGFLLLWGHRDSLRFPALLLLAGIIYGFLLNAGSNQGKIVFCNGCTLAAVGGVFAFAAFIRALPSSLSVRRAVSGLLAAAMLCSVTYTLSHQVSCSGMTVTLTSGPLKGERTSPSNAEKYESFLSDAQTIRSLPEGPLAIRINNSWLYVAVGFPVAAHSAWSGASDTAREMDEAYWLLHPEKAPRYLYLTAKSAEDDDTAIREAEEAGLEIRELNSGVLIIYY